MFTFISVYSLYIISCIKKGSTYTMSIVELLSLAKNKNKNAIKESVETFNSIIKKYGKRMGEDGENELILFTIELIFKLPRLNNAGKIVSYVSTSIKNYFYKKSYINKSVSLHELPLEYNDEFYSQSYLEFLDEKILLKDLIKKLSTLQQYIIHRKFYLDYPESFIANELNVSRQAINNIKKRALTKLKQLVTGQ